MTEHFAHTPAGRGPHHLMLGTVTVSRLLGGAETDGKLALLELTGLPGSGPGAHVDPWRESFYVLEGELTFRFEEDGSVHTAVARAGDAVSISPGVGHAFSVSGPDRARYLMVGTGAGIEDFFADAGEPMAEPALDAARAFDRERLLAAFAKHGLRTDYAFPAEPAAT
jgi:quercetin dioxygenase-like cupin family protein